MVEVYFRIPKEIFAATIVQLRRRIHNLRDQLHAMEMKRLAKGSESGVSDVEISDVRANLVLCEGIRTWLEENVRPVDKFVVPESDEKGQSV